MAKLSELRTAAEIHQKDMADPAYQREYERTRLANDVALRVLAYRTQHHMSQAELARRLGMRQPHIARLESGEHEPSLHTLTRLSSALGIEFSVDITPGGTALATLRTTVPDHTEERVVLAGVGAVSAPLALVMTEEATPSGGANRKTASPGRDQKTARLRDLERLFELVCPYSAETSAPIDVAIARMPTDGQAEARDILARIGTLGEDPDNAAARQQILMDTALAETILREILTRPHYMIRGGHLVTDPATGEPVPDDRAERQVRALLASIVRMRGRLSGIPSGENTPATAHQKT